LPSEISNGLGEAGVGVSRVDEQTSGATP